MNTQFRTMSGRLFDLVNPRADDVDPADMVSVLARIPRYNAHTDPIWSVADHLSLSWKIAMLPRLRRSPRARLDLILHDGDETWLGDMTSPFKMAMRALGGGEALQQIESRTKNAMRQRFGMSWVVDLETYKWIKDIDLLTLYIEQLNFSHLSAAERVEITNAIPEDVRVLVPRLRPLSEQARASQFRFLLAGAARDVIAAEPQFALTGMVDLTTLSDPSGDLGVKPIPQPGLFSQPARHEEFSMGFSD